MSAQMQQAANDAGQEACLEPARPGLESAQSGQAQPEDGRTAGVLDDANAPQPWDKYATSDDITSNPNSAVERRRHADAD